VGFAVNVAIARHLGESAFGVLSFAISICALLGTLAELGLQDVAVRELARDAQHGTAIVYSVLRARFVAAVCSWGGALAVAVWLRPLEPRVWLVVGVAAIGVLFQPLDIVTAWAQVHARLAGLMLARNAALMLSYGLRLLFVLYDYSLEAFAVCIALEAALTGAAAYIFYRKCKPRFLSVKGRSYSWLLRESSMLLVCNFCIAGIFQSDRLIIARSLGDSVLGIYSAAVRLVDAFHAVPVTVAAVLLPRLVSLRSQAAGEYWKFTKWVACCVVVASFVISTLLALCAAPIVHALYGDKFSGSAHVLSVYAWTFSLVSIVSFRTRIMIVEGLSHWVLLSTITTLIVAVAANLVLVPRFAATGGAVAAVCAWSFSAFVTPFLTRRSRQVLWRVVVGK
jgi:O-antigen/teichoic acid export membrane protein